MKADRNSYERLLSRYLDVLDESTGYTFRNGELMQHAKALSYDQLRANTEELEKKYGYGEWEGQ